MSSYLRPIIHQTITDFRYHLNPMPLLKSLSIKDIVNIFWNTLMGVSIFTVAHTSTHLVNKISDKIIPKKGLAHHILSPICQGAAIASGVIISSCLIRYLPSPLPVSAEKVLRTCALLNLSLFALKHIAALFPTYQSKIDQINNWSMELIAIGGTVGYFGRSSLYGMSVMAVLTKKFYQG